MKAIKKTKFSILSWQFSILIFCLLLSNSSNAQVSKSVLINDILPDLPLNNLMRLGQGTVNTKDLYKKGMLIINFWATWCKPCVSELKTLAEQVKMHEGKLQVLSAGYENRATIEQFLSKNPELKNSEIIFISNDQIFGKMFFHQALPHNVWVDQMGIVKSITGGNELTPENIKQFLNGHTSNMKVKKEMPFDQFKPMHIPDSLIEYRSIFNKTLPGVSLSGTTIDGNGFGFATAKRFFGFNMLSRYLFWFAHQMPGYPTPYSTSYLIEVKTSDSSKFFWPGEQQSTSNYKGISRSDWSDDHEYSYELRVPEALEDGIFFQKVIKDLEFNLKVKTYRESRMKKCVVVRYKKNSNLIKSAKDIDKPSCSIIGNKLVVSKVPIQYLLEWISQSTYTDIAASRRIEPYVDKTGINEAITFSVNLGNDHTLYKSQKHIEQCLSEQTGLDFKFTKHLYPILIITDI